MIAVTHLLGTGHLSRALTLGRAFAEAGHRVLLASGGMPAPHLAAHGVTLLQLPPLRSDGTDFARLLDETGTEAGARLFAARRDALCGAIRDLTPDALITELFPFGRRALSGEFLALLDAARDLPRRPRVLSSVRDILAPPSRPEKAARTERIVLERYDAVLVHSDPALVPLAISWPVAGRLEGRLRYTGYVAPPPAEPHPQRAGEGEILVSSGGGAVGLPIFRAAIGAARLMPGRHWRLLVGGGRERLAELHAMSPPGNVTIEPARPDFRQMLHHAAASVSMCGYNTALDLLQAGTPAVLIPFDDGNEVEQGLRARNLATLPGFDMLRSAELTGEALSAAVARVIGEGRRSGAGPTFDGAARTVAITREIVEARG